MSDIEFGRVEFAEQVFEIYDPYNVIQIAVCNGIGIIEVMLYLFLDLLIACVDI